MKDLKYQTLEAVIFIPIQIIPITSIEKDNINFVITPSIRKSKVPSLSNCAMPTLVTVHTYEEILQRPQRQQFAPTANLYRKNNKDAKNDKRDSDSEKDDDMKGLQSRLCSGSVK